VSYDVMELVKLKTETCCRCGVLFAMPATLQQAALDQRGPGGRRFWCPNGHEQWYVGESEAQQQKRRAERVERALEASRAYGRAVQDQLDASTRSNRALRAVNTRTRRRIARGVCPCCNRTFADLSAHMAGQHPDYAGEQEG
jgi:hypothetical protein